ncbi:Kinase [Hexamita inflata]|uniref:non-specific serine/threonine protein kinase n=1 Tax=Hexamita inflata TaxID=28002 RepID=A0AA86PMR8_9EUKA|nr:Kinase [Hexamita inflata]
MESRYVVKQYMSRGAQAETFVALDTESDVQVILKLTHKADLTVNQQNQLLREAQLQRKISSEFVVKVLNAYETASDIVTVLEFAPFGDFETQIQKRSAPFDESAIITWAMQLLLGLKHTHSNNIIHRDVKTANIVLIQDDKFPNAKAMLCDFGIATENNLAKTVVGTPYYMSPQACKGLNYGQKTDIWALGVVLYRLCTFEYPFFAGNQIALRARIASGVFQEVKGYSEELTGLINRMLEQNEALRPEAEELLKDPIFESRLRHFKYNEDADTVEGTQ